MDPTTVGVQGGMMRPAARLSKSMSLREMRRRMKRGVIRVTMAVVVMKMRIKVVMHMMMRTRLTIHLKKACSFSSTASLSPDPSLSLGSRIRRRPSRFFASYIHTTFFSYN